jgi:hypothetical protein
MEIDFMDKLEVMPKKVSRGIEFGVIANGKGIFS